MKRLFNNFPLLFSFVFFLSINIFYASAQSSNKLYMCMPDVGPRTKQLMKQNNVQDVPIFGMTGMTLDAQKFSSAITKSIPDANYDGYAVIDWEGKAGTALEMESQDSPAYKDALSEFTKAIKLAKQMRPKAKWGFWGLPFQPLDKMGQRKDVNSDVPLLKLCDVLYPMLYVPYNMDQSSNGGRRAKADKDAMISENLKGVFTLNRRLYKKIMVFIWYRYYTPGFKDNSYKLIPLDEFSEYAKEIMGYNYQGKKVDGLIWWGPDAYFYYAKIPQVVDEFNASKRKSFPDYRDSLMYKYMSEILKTTSPVN
jgi:hypothetical protein